MNKIQRTPGRVVWRENMTPDLKKAQAFYGELFGWSYEDFDMGPAGNYPMIKVNGKTVAGIMQQPPDMNGMPSYWTSYVSVESADGALATATKLGGKVLWGPNDVPGVGRMAMIADSEGASISLLESATDDPKPGERPGPGEFCWESLNVKEPEAAKKFWCAVFPWKASSGAGMDTFAVGEGMENQIADLQRLQAPGVPPHWLTFVVTQKIEGSLALAQKLGGKVMAPAMEIPKIGKIAVILDNQGAALGFFEPGGI